VAQAINLACALTVRPTLSILRALDCPISRHLFPRTGIPPRPLLGRFLHPIESNSFISRSRWHSTCQFSSVFVCQRVIVRAANFA
jgi:hypothetical protein